MKKIEEYFSTYNKNLDNITNLDNASSLPTSNYKPRIGIEAKNIIPKIGKIAMISLSVFVLTGISFYMLYQNKSEEFEAIVYNILKNMNIVNDYSKIESGIFSDISYVELNYDELAAIGIIKKGDTISIITEDILMPSDIDLNYQKIKDSLYNLPENKKKGVKIEVDTYKKYSKLGYETTMPQLIKSKYNISFYTFNSYIMQYQGWDHNKYSSFSPVSIQSFCKSKVGYSVSYIAYLNPTNMPDEYRSGLDSLSKQFINRVDRKSINSMGALSKLIPVKIKLYNKSGYKPDNKKYTIVETDIILWYIPTDEFINALPERYSKRLKKELVIIDKIENGIIDKKEACMELNESESILGLCPIFHNNIEIKAIYPSPGMEDTHIKFDNGKEQKLSVFLYDMTGKEVRCVENNKLFPPGEHNLWIDLSNLKQGIYIAVIIDEGGNSISAKFIKE